MSGSADLVAFLTARLDEDEQAALRLTEAYERDEPRPPSRLINLGALLDPARVLRECEAKRKLLALHSEIRGVEDGYRGERETPRTRERGWTWYDASDALLKALALPYSDHPDYDESWRP